MFGNHDALNRVDRFIQAVFGVDDDVVKFFDPLEFFAGHGNTHVESFTGFRFTRSETTDQFGLIAGGEEDQNGFGAQAADGGRALHVQAHDDIFAAGEGFAHLGFGNTFVVVVDISVFEQLVLLNHLGKFSLGDEVIIYTMLLARADGAGGGGDDKVKGQATRLHFGQYSVFAHSGRAGDDDEEGFGSRRGEGDGVGHNWI